VLATKCSRTACVGRARNTDETPAAAAANRLISVDRRQLVYGSYEHLPNENGRARVIEIRRSRKRGSASDSPPAYDVASLSGRWRIRVRVTSRAIYSFQIEKIFRPSSSVRKNFSISSAISPPKHTPLARVKRSRRVAKVTRVRDIGPSLLYGVFTTGGEPSWSRELSTSCGSRWCGDRASAGKSNAGSSPKITRRG